MSCIFTDDYGECSSSSRKCTKALRKECSKSYRSYKNYCKSANKCVTGDISRLNLDELEDLLEELNENADNFYECAKGRVDHTRTCVDQLCRDDGHKKAIEIAKTSLMNCEKKIIAIEKKIKKLKRSANKSGSPIKRGSTNKRRKSRNTRNRRSSNRNRRSNHTSKNRKHRKRSNGSKKKYNSRSPKKSVKSPRTSTRSNRSTRSTRSNTSNRSTRSNHKLNPYAKSFIPANYSPRKYQRKRDRKYRNYKRSIKR